MNWRSSFRNLSSAARAVDRVTADLRSAVGAIDSLGVVVGDDADGAL